MALGRAEAIEGSGPIASSATVSGANVAALLYGVNLISAGVKSRVDLRDGGSGGTILVTLSQAATTDNADKNQKISFYHPVIFSTDIYATITGADAKVYAFFKKI